MRVRRVRSGFTLVEIMIVVAIIALLASFVIPGLIRAQRNSRISQAAANLKTYTTAFNMYYIDNGNFPVDSHADLPPGMDVYITESEWDKPVMGGTYNWEGPSWGEGGPYSYAGISLYQATASVNELAQLDAILDDGNLATGYFRLETNGRYTYIIAE